MVSKSSLLDWMGPVLEFLVHCFLGLGLCLFIFFWWVWNHHYRQRYSWIPSHVPQTMGHQRIARGSDEPGTADGGFGQKGLGLGCLLSFSSSSTFLTSLYLSVLV